MTQNGAAANLPAITLEYRSHLRADAGAYSAGPALAAAVNHTGDSMGIFGWKKKKTANAATESSAAGDQMSCGSAKGGDMACGSTSGGEMSCGSAKTTVKVAVKTPAKKTAARTPTKAKAKASTKPISKKK